MSLYLIAHQKALGQKTVDQKAVGRYPYALVHVQSFSAEVGDAQEKVPVFDAGTSASHDVPQP